MVIFAYGYFLANPLGMILGSIVPVGYVVWLFGEAWVSPRVCGWVEELEDSAGGPAAKFIIDEKIEPGRVVPFPKGQVGEATDLFGHFEGKWFVHTFVATYADTNSVGMFTLGCMRCG